MDIRAATVLSMTALAIFTMYSYGDVKNRFMIVPVQQGFVIFDTKTQSLNVCTNGKCNLMENHKKVYYPFKPSEDMRFVPTGMKLLEEEVAVAKSQREYDQKEEKNLLAEQKVKYEEALKEQKAKYEDLLASKGPVQESSAPPDFGPPSY